MNWFRKRFVRSVMAVAGGTAAGQLILVAAAPLITRIYGPEAYGTWGVFNSIVGMIVPIAALTYATAIVLPRDEQTALRLTQLSLWLTALSAVVTTLALTFFGAPIAEWLQIGEDWQILPLVGLFVLGMGFGEVARQSLIRRESFRTLAITGSTTSVLTVGSQLLGGIISATGAALVISSTIGRVCDGAIKSYLAWGVRRPRRQVRSADAPSMREAAREYRRFPLYRAPQVLLDSLSQALPIAMLAVFFGPVSAGFYTLCRSILALPGNVIGNAIGDVLYPRIARAFHDGEELTPLVSRAVGAVALATAGPFLVVIAFGPALFGFVFGDEWSTAGVYAQWLSVWLWVAIWNRPVLQVIHVLSLQRFHLIFTAAGTLLRLAAILAAYYAIGNDVVAIAWYSIVGALSNAVLVAVVLLACSRRDKNRSSEDLD